MALDVSHRWHGSSGAPLGAAVFRSGFSANGRTDLELRILFTTHFQVCLCQNVLIEITFFFFFKIYRYESETGILQNTLHGSLNLK